MNKSDEVRVMNSSTLMEQPGIFIARSGLGGRRTILVTIRFCKIASKAIPDLNASQAGPISKKRLAVIGSDHPGVLRVACRWRVVCIVACTLIINLDVLDNITDYAWNRVSDVTPCCEHVKTIFRLRDVEATEMANVLQALGAHLARYSEGGRIPERFVRRSSRYILTQGEVLFTSQE